MYFEDFGLILQLNLLYAKYFTQYITEPFYNIPVPPFDSEDANIVNYSSCTYMISESIEGMMCRDIHYHVCDCI